MVDGERQARGRGDTIECATSCRFWLYGTSKLHWSYIWLCSNKYCSTTNVCGEQQARDAGRHRGSPGSRNVPQPRRRFSQLIVLRERWFVSNGQIQRVWRREKSLSTSQSEQSCLQLLNSTSRLHCQSLEVGVCHSHFTHIDHCTSWSALSGQLEASLPWK